MEKFSQFRDRGTQIAPFLPIVGPRTPFQTIYGALLFAVRLPFFLSLSISYFLVFQWLPIGSFCRKAWLWSILLVSGVWWIDLQVEGVKKGSLSKQSTKLPTPGSVIVSTSTSPLDAIYLAAIFDPIFARSHPATRNITTVSLLSAILYAFLPPSLAPPYPTSSTTTLATLVRQNPTRTIVLFPEATTTNGRGVLRFAPSLDTLGPETLVFPISLRYSPADVTTPVPGTYLGTLYTLLSRPTHCIRVRIAEAIRNVEEEGESAGSSDTVAEEKKEKGGLNGRGVGLPGPSSGRGRGERQSRLSEMGAEALARVARSKRLNLGVKEKVVFVDAWYKNERANRR